MSNLVIAIDGPAGAGKSTVAKLLARDLGLTYLDTGAMYRAIALKARRAGLGPTDGEAAAKIGDDSVISFGVGDPQPVFLDGEDVTSAIRLPEIGELASALSAFTPVRRVLVERQKALIGRGGVVLEGRDATTVIAPSAQVKVYLTASLDERAKRRHLELEGKGLPSAIETVRDEVETRDHRDMNREDSPLMVAPDAIVVESAGHTPTQVAEKIKELIPAAFRAIKT